MRRTREQTRLSKLEDAPATITDVARPSSVVQPGMAIKREPRDATVVMKKEPAAVAKKSTKPLKKEPKAAAPVVKSESREMAEYERKRLENIQRNLEFMKSMGVSTVRMPFILAWLAVGSVVAVYSK